MAFYFVRRPFLYLSGAIRFNPFKIRSILYSDFTICIRTKNTLEYCLKVDPASAEPVPFIIYRGGEGPSKGALAYDEEQGR